jgi:hypothetical protein
MNMKKTMKHKRKKIASGEYEYRGWKIKKRVCSFSKQTLWLASCVEYTSDHYTLRDAKEDIDLCIEEECKMNYIEIVKDPEGYDEPKGYYYNIVDEDRIALHGDGPFDSHEAALNAGREYRGK